jgi:hypothetical protein
MWKWWRRWRRALFPGLVFVTMLSACSTAWSYEFRPDVEDDEPGLDSDCGIVELHLDHPWSGDETFGQGRFCKVEGR